MGENLNEKMDLILEKLAEKQNKKKFRLPRVGLKQKLKRDYVLVFWLKTNGTLTKPKWQKIENGMIYNKKTDANYVAAGEYILRYEDGTPIMLIPEWNTIPIAPSNIDSEKSSIVAQKIMVRAAKLAQLKIKGKGMSGKTIFLLLIGLIIIIYLLTQSGGLGGLF